MSASDRHHTVRLRHGCSCAEYPIDAPNIQCRRCSGTYVSTHGSHGSFGFIIAKLMLHSPRRHIRPEEAIFRLRQLCQHRRELARVNSAFHVATTATTTATTTEDVRRARIRSSRTSDSCANERPNTRTNERHHRITLHGFRSPRLRISTLVYPPPHQGHPEFIDHSINSPPAPPLPLGLSLSTLSVFHSRHLEYVEYVRASPPPKNKNKKKTSVFPFLVFPIYNIIPNVAPPFLPAHPSTTHHAAIFRPEFSPIRRAR